MYAYCGNNPSNLCDDEGNVPKLLKKIGSAIKTTAKKVVKTVNKAAKKVKKAVDEFVEPLVEFAQPAVDSVKKVSSCVSIDIEAGLGVGAKINAPYNTSVSAVAILQKDNFTINIEDSPYTKEAEFAGGISMGPLDLEASKQYIVDYRDVREHNKFFSNPEGKWVNSVDANLTMGGAVYLGLGIGVTVSFD